MECYSCGAKLGREDSCPNCGANVKLYKKIIMASNAYYNDALDKASVRNLSGAVESLKVSLRFNKRNVEARNLLGLIHFEMGEVVTALTEWVISRSYQPKDNEASRYLDEIQNNRTRLDTINQTIKKYNQALAYCQQDSRDLAIIQLKKVLSLNPNLVKAHQLLALLYIQERKYDLAKKCLRNAGKIDANNTITLRYLKEVNAELRENSPNKKKKSEELVSYQSGNETIIQPRYLKDNSAIGTVVNLIIGIAIGAAVTVFLIVPGVRRDALNSAKQDVVDANSAIASKNQTITALEAQIEEMTAEVTDVKSSQEGYASRINSYEELLNAYVAYLREDIDAAGTALGNVNVDYLSDAAKSVYETVDAQVNAEYIRALYKAATDAYAAQDFEEAITNYEIVVSMDENYDAGNALFYLAQSYRKTDDSENARIYYQKVADLYPGTQRAGIAQEYLNRTGR